MAQYFTVSYNGYYKYVRDLRTTPQKVYVLYQVRARLRCPAAVGLLLAPPRQRALAAPPCDSTGSVPSRRGPSVRQRMLRDARVARRWLQ